MSLSQCRGAAPTLFAILLGCTTLTACGDDDSEAARRGVGSACASSDDCEEEGQQCLTDFKGGMCGIADCTSSEECPGGSVCVADPDFSRNFCLLVCSSKPECNVHRSAEEEANCTSTLDQLDPPDGADPKVCRPPSN